MGNLLQYTDKSKTIDNKLRALIAQINHDYKAGKIRTETEYYYRIKNMLSTFYDSLTKPSFKYRPAVTTPVSSDYNNMINEAYNDMEFILKDCEALKEYVSQSFVDAQLSRAMMTNELTYLTNKVNNIKESIATNQTSGMVVFSDSFNDFNSVGNVQAMNACTVDTFDGILTLRQDTSANTVITGIAIDNESNGFPGNTHCVDTLNSSLHYLGQDNLHNNINAVIDGNKDTWFEFELFNIDDKVRRECNSYGFDYEEGVSWVNNDVKQLVLKVTLTLAQDSVCSWLSILPYISDAKGGTYCILKKCEVFAANNYVYKVAENVPFDNVLTFAFPTQAVSKVELTFVQDTKYLTKVGHNYFTNVNTQELSIYQDIETSDSYTRIDGPKPKVSLLGVQYDPETKWLDYSNLTTSRPTEAFAKANLFTVPESTIERKAGEEMIDAYRYMIGIREIRLPNCVFADESEYVSKVFKTDEEITSIMLESEEYIPGNDESVLEYFVSVDNGSTWYPIVPIQRAHNGIYKYYINNDSIENLLTNNSDKFKAQNLSILTGTRQIQLKIKMKKPTSVANYNNATPIVYSYKLKLTTGGETIEY